MFISFKAWLKCVKDIKPCEFRSLTTEEQERLHNEYTLLFLMCTEMDGEYQNGFYEQTERG